MPTRPEETKQNQDRFLEAFETIGSITRTAEEIGITRNTHYLWCRTSDSYRQRFQEAVERRGDYLEDLLMERIQNGYEEPVYQGGRLAGYRTKFSTAELIFALKAAKPEKYGENQNINHSGRISHEVTMQDVLDEYDRRESQRSGGVNQDSGEVCPDSIGRIVGVRTSPATSGSDRYGGDPSRN